MKTLAVVTIFLTIVSCSAWMKFPSTNDDIDFMRQRVLELILWPPKDNITTIVELATYYGEKMNSSCYWEDINYADRTSAVWAVEEHLIRVNYMLQALTVPGSSLQK